MPTKADLGTRFTCFSCSTKFYDLNRPTPVCPECQSDQTEAPATDLKALLSSGKGKKRRVSAKAEEVELPAEIDEDDADDDDDADPFDDDDDDDDDMGDDEDE